MSVFYNLIRMKDLVIPSGTKPSNAVTDFGDADSIIIYSGATLTGTINVQVSIDNTNWVDLKSGGSNITVGATAGVVVTDIPALWLRVNSGSNEGADRTFQIVKQTIAG